MVVSKEDGKGLDITNTKIHEATNAKPRVINPIFFFLE